jgi:hypothetical protein
VWTNRRNAGAALGAWLSLAGACSGGGGGPAPAPTPDRPPAMGIEECDRYARVACSCPDERIRGPLCDGARILFEGWTDALESSPSGRGGITQMCAQMEQQMTPRCARP